MLGSTASSRSIMTASAPAASALENLSGRVAGTNRADRTRCDILDDSVLNELAYLIFGIAKLCQYGCRVLAQRWDGVHAGLEGGIGAGRYQGRQRTRRAAD